RLPVPDRRRVVVDRGVHRPRRQPALVARPPGRRADADHGLLDQRPVLHREGLHAARLRRHLGADARCDRHRAGLPPARTARQNLGLMAAEPAPAWKPENPSFHPVRMIVAWVISALALLFAAWI